MRPGPSHSHGTAQAAVNASRAASPFAESEKSFRGGERPESGRERFPSQAPGSAREAPAMFDPDIHIDIPTGDLLAEIGIDPAAASEVIAEDRSIRCPGRDQVRPDRGTVFLDVVMPLDGALCEAALAHTLGPVLSRRPADWR